MITEIKIKNFKCFEDFKANGFKRVNLIAGKNNVGKTALMEACWIYEQNKNSANINEAFFNMVKSIILIREFRDIANHDNFDLLKKFQGLIIKSNNQSVKLNLEINNLDVKLEINDFKIDASLISSDLLKKYLSDNKPKNFIPSSKINNELIIHLYDCIKKNRKKNQLNKYIHQFDHDILEFEIIENVSQVYLDSRKQFEDISELGHGLKRYIAIISAILVSQNSCLFLDEIENGIHYTHLDKLWEIILTLSEKMNCQVFATTHSKDCIESYYKVSKKMEYKNDIAYIKMTRLKSGKISSSVYDYELLEIGMEENHEVRGW
jgi:AAA15 family ATPase/GTPase